MKHQHLIGLLLGFMCGWLVMSSIRQNNQINDLQRHIGGKAAESSAAAASPKLSNAALTEAATIELQQAREQEITRLFVKEQQQSLQRQVEAFLLTTEPLLLSTNLDRESLRHAITHADELHAKLDPNNFNPILEIRFEARRGTLQSLIKQ